MIEPKTKDKIIHFSSFSAIPKNKREDQEDTKNRLKIGKVERAKRKK